MLTTNPGSVGHQWVRNYFRIQVPDESTGELYKPEETIEEEIYSTVAKRKIKRTRVFIPAGIADNPSLSDEYIANLEGIEDEKTKRAWLYGDWNVLAGIYFDNFRPNGPGFDEPVNADHVIQPGRNCETYPELEPWWPRVIACDWGYQHNSAVYWGCRNPDTKQVHIYRELVLNRTSPVDLGVAIAEHSLDDLNGLADNHMFMYLSHDAYSATQHAVRGQVRSIAELIMDGINRVLGDNSAHVPYMDMSDEEKTTDFHAHYEQWMSRVRQHRRRSITILHADTNRVLGFTNMRAMMNWNPPVSASYIDRDPDLERMIFREKGVVAGQHYQHLTTPQDDGLYPRLLVWAEGYQHGRRVGCPALIQAIPQAIHDEKRVEDVAKTHFEGLDSLDACRYLLQGVKALEHVRMPPETERLQAISRFKASNPHYTFNDLCQINMTMEMKQKQQRQNQINFRTPRRARALRHAINSQPSSKMIH